MTTYPLWETITVSLALLVPLTAMLIKFWVPRLVEQKFKKEVQAYQHTLDKELEAHKARLESDLKDREMRLAIVADRVKSELERGVMDYSLWTAKRHEATAMVYSKFLRISRDLTAGAIGGIDVNNGTINIQDPSASFNHALIRVWNLKAEAEDIYRENAIFLSDTICAEVENFLDQLAIIQQLFFNSINGERVIPTARMSEVKTQVFEMRKAIYADLRSEIWSER